MSSSEKEPNQDQLDHYEKLLARVDAELARVDTRHKDWLRWLSMLGSVLLVCGVYFFGRSFSEIREDNKNRVQEIREDMARKMDVLKQEKEAELDAFKRQLENRYESTVKETAEKQTSEAIGRIVGDTLEQRMKVYNAMMLALAGSRSAFKEIQEVKRTMSREMGELATAVLNVVKSTDRNVNFSLAVDEQLLQRELRTTDTVVLNQETVKRLLNSEKESARLGVIIASTFRALPGEIEASWFLPLLIDRLRIENSLRICEYIIGAINTESDTSFTLEDIDTIIKLWDENPKGFPGDYARNSLGTQ